MESTQPEIPPSTVTLAQQKREKSDRLWKLGIRAVATVFAIIALVLQIIILVRRIHLETDSNLTSSYYGDNYYGVWVSPESFFFVSLLFYRAAMHISRLTAFELTARIVNRLEWFRIHHSLHPQTQHSPRCSCWTRSHHLDGPFICGPHPASG